MVEVKKSKKLSPKAYPLIVTGIFGIAALVALTLV